MGLNFYETVMGKRFIEGTVPTLVKNIQSLTDEMKIQNGLKERELKLKEKELELKEREIALKELAVKSQTAYQKTASDNADTQEECIDVDLQDGRHLQAWVENCGSCYKDEICIGIKNKNSSINRLAVVGQAYGFDTDDNPYYIPDKIDIFLEDDERTIVLDVESDPEPEHIADESEPEEKPTYKKGKLVEVGINRNIAGRIAVPVPDNINTKGELIAFLENEVDTIELARNMEGADEDAYINYEYLKPLNFELGNSDEE